MDYPILTKVGAPVWVNIPGTPFTFLKSPEREERLPGMVQWAPRHVVERVGRGIEEGKSEEELVSPEADRGLLSNILTGTGVGGVAGGLGGRVAAGEASTAPFKKLLQKGVTRGTLKGLGRVPGVAKALPAIGAGLGAFGGLGKWEKERPGRRGEAQEVAQGLLREQILQQHSLRKAQESASNPILKQLPSESATMPIPTAVVPSDTGV